MNGARRWGAGLLGVPLGESGSGRLRYANAMALYQTGQMCAARLEAYRIAAASDTEPLDRVLAERGLSFANAPADRICNLLDQAQLYLRALPGHGVAEVCDGINRLRDGPPSLAVTPENTVVTAHLPAALAALGQTHPDLAGAIGAARPDLNWITYDGYPPEQIGAGFATGHAYTSFRGQDAAIAALDFDFGLFLIAPHVLYRDHNHAAPELYAPLTGPHGWRFGPDDPLTIKPAHQPVWNPPFQPHLTKVGPTPFLCFFGWTRDVEQVAQVIPAPDWAPLEALRLGP